MADAVLWFLAALGGFTVMMLWLTLTAWMADKLEAFLKGGSDG